MGNGYPTRQPDELSQFRQDLATLVARVKVLESPTGTQNANSLQVETETAADTNITWLNVGSGGFVSAVSVTVSPDRPVRADISYYTPNLFTYAAAGSGGSFSSSSYQGRISVDGTPVSATAFKTTASSGVASARGEDTAPYLIQISVLLSPGDHTVAHEYQTVVSGIAGGARNSGVLTVLTRGVG